MIGPRTILRMPLPQRVQHWVLILTFALLVITGLPMIFDPTPLLHSVFSAGDAWWLRGLIHRAAAVGLIGLCVYHLFYILLSTQGNRDFKALLPGMKDAKDGLGTLTYQLGLPRLLRRTAKGRLFRRRWSAWIPERHPQYGRYTFIEKFEYLAVVWGSIVMVASGLLLWFEEATMALFPLWVFDVVRVVHSYEAILAFLAIIIWHMYQVHVRPGAFPMSRIWLDGRISLEELREEHPLEYEQLLAAGLLPETASGPTAGEPLAGEREAPRPTPV